MSFGFQLSFISHYWLIHAHRCVALNRSLRSVFRLTFEKCRRLHGFGVNFECLCNVLNLFAVYMYKGPLMTSMVVSLTLIPVFMKKLVISSLSTKSQMKAFIVSSSLAHVAEPCTVYSTFCKIESFLEDLHFDQF